MSMDEVTAEGKSGIKDALGVKMPFCGSGGKIIPDKERFPKHRVKSGLQAERR